MIHLAKMLLWIVWELLRTHVHYWSFITHHDPTLGSFFRVPETTHSGVSTLLGNWTQLDRASFLFSSFGGSGANRRDESILSFRPFLSATNSTADQCAACWVTLPFCLSWEHQGAASVITHGNPRPAFRKQGNTANPFWTQQVFPAQNWHDNSVYSPYTVSWIIW